MLSLQTSRVLVIDDEPSEAAPILEALGRHGLGAVYLRGNRQEELPREPLHGIRLLFLDMDLGVGGSGRQVAASTMRVVTRVLADDGVPIIVVAWTKHPEYVDEFRSLCRGIGPRLDPALVFMVAKPADNGEGILEPARAAVSEGLKAKSPLDVLWYWEAAAHDAVDRTSSALANLAVASQPWAEEVQSVLGALVSAVGGATIVNARAALSALFSGMVPLLLDRLEHYEHNDGIVDLAAPLVTAAAAHRNKTRKLSAEQRGAVNTMLLFASEGSDGVEEHQPGSILTRKAWRGKDFPIGPNRAVTSLALKGDTLDLPRPENHAKDDARKEEQRKRTQLLRSCAPLLLEVTPPCDHCQGKARMSRMIAGLIVPLEFEKRIKQGEFLRKVGPLYITPAGGSRRIAVMLVLNARFVVGADLLAARRQRPAARLRADVLRDVLNWYSGHAARPGYVYL